MGEFSTLQSQLIEAENHAAPKIDYGLNGSMPVAAHPEELTEGHGNYQPTMIVEAAQPVEHHNDDSFASKPQVGTGKVHEDDNF
jgi:hypothetical protein